jgi:hypothetical protein
MGAHASEIKAYDSGPRAYRCGPSETRKAHSTLRDWLELHGLTKQQCVNVLARATNYQVQHATPAQCGPPAAEAWRTAAAALEARFPEMTAAITETRDTTTLSLHRPGTPPLTAPFRGGAGVRMHYQGRVADMLTLAHEFGHALQITLTGGAFVNPITREICGFLAEHALLAALENDRSELHEGAVAAWRADNAGYLVKHGAALAKALFEPTSRYTYAWNYPVARVLAAESARHLTARFQRGIYENRVPVAGLVKFMECTGRTARSCNMACIEFTGVLPELEIARK